MLANLYLHFLSDYVKLLRSDIRYWLVACRADLACDIALEATSTVSIEQNGRREIDIKRYAKVEKVPC